MSPRCPGRDEWLWLALGEATERRAGDLRAHAAGCRACAEARAEAEGLLALLPAPVPGVPSERAVERLMGRLDDPPRERRPRWRWRAGLLVAVGAAAAVALVVTGIGAPPPGELLARGGGGGASAASVELFALEAEPRRLTPGSTLTLGTPVVAAAANPGAREAWLLAFALDAANEIHWIHPAFVDPVEDPQAVALAPGSSRRALPDGAVPTGLDPGPVRLVWLVAPHALRVSALERLAPAEREPAALRRRFPAVQVGTLEVTLVAPAPAGEGRPR